MKMAKRIFAMTLALMMILSLSVAAFAAPGHNHTITIKNSNKGYEYKAYQIFAGTLGSDGVLSNIEWGSGIKGEDLLAELVAKYPDFKDCTDAKSVAELLAGAKGMDHPKAIQFAEIANRFIKGEGTPSTWKDGVYTISGLDDGYYLVVNTNVPEDANNTSVSRYIMEVVRDVTVAHKGDFPKVEKKILEGTLKVDVNEASIGDYVYYEITGTIPTNISQYATYYYAFNDVLSKGLTYNGDMKITVNGTDVTEYFWIEASAYDEVNGTTIYAGIGDLLALKLLDLDSATEGNQPGAITHDTKVVLTYSAILNENAVIADVGNPNKVRLEYDNNPNDDGEGTTTPPPPPPSKPTPTDPYGTTPWDEVKTFVTELTIMKKDGAGNVLTGAEFTLTGDAVKTMIVTGAEFVLAGEGETANYWKLIDGKYTNVAPKFDDPTTSNVDEATAQGYVGYNPENPNANIPAQYVLKNYTKPVTKTESVSVSAYVDQNGYITFTGLGAGTYTLTETVTPSGYNTIAPIVFTVEFNPNTTTFSENSSFLWVDSDNTIAGEIINVAGTVLPSTGGVGTTMFYVIGAVLFLSAAVVLVTKKRMAA